MSIVPVNNSLPAHLASFRTMPTAISKNITGGISGKSHPKLSIRAARFRLLGSDGVETPWDSLSINLIIVDGNPNVSKRYYAKAYDGNTEEATPPDCYSDNGVSPSPSAANKQCATCAACPHNVWGSKITPTGGKSRACSDSKRLAVLVADLDDNEVYELSIPGTSMRGLHEVVTKLDKQGIPAPAVVFNVSFDSEASYPKLIFRPTGYISAEQAEVVKSLMDSEEVKEAIGTEERPAQEPVQIAAVPQQPVIATASVSTPASVVNIGTFAMADEKPVAKKRAPRVVETAAPVAKQPVPVEVAPATTNSDLDDLLAGLFDGPA